jgi:hypothetical protein
LATREDFAWVILLAIGVVDGDRVDEFQGGCVVEFKLVSEHGAVGGPQSCDCCKKLTVWAHVDTGSDVHTEGGGLLYF